MTPEPPAAAPDRLPQAPWLTDPATRAVIAALEAQGGPGVARFVGGCVRDTLLDRAGPGLDIDIATTLTPPDVVAALKRARLRAVPTGIDHGTVTAICEHRPFEITTLRRDVETDGRHAVVAFTDDWALDAARRDFRLNALYAEPDGRLHDPTGGGAADALAGRIVFVGEPRARIAEDYLRILRFFRFYAWYGRGEPDADALTACAAMAGGMGALSAERIAKELLKLLAAPDPRATVRAMADAGVLARLLPGFDLERLGRVVALERALGEAADGPLRLAALSTEDPTPLSRRLKLSNVLRERLVGAAGDLEAAADLTPVLARRRLYAMGPRAFQDRLRLMAQASEADAVATLSALAQNWRRPALPIDGAQIKAAGVAEGPQVGRVLRAVEDWWIAQDFPVDPAAAQAVMIEAASRSG